MFFAVVVAATGVALDLQVVPDLQQAFSGPVAVPLTCVQVVGVPEECEQVEATGGLVALLFATAVFVEVPLPAGIVVLITVDGVLSAFITGAAILAAGVFAVVIVVVVPVVVVVVAAAAAV